MAFSIKNHRLEGVRWNPTPNKSSGTITPELIIVHDTAGSSFSSSESWMTNPAAKAAAHLLIGRAGDIVQMGAFNQKLWHAGSSSWRGRQYCNGFSIGIEFDNPGILDKHGAAWTGRRYDEAEDCYSEYHGHVMALPYTEAQIETGAEIVTALCRHYGITELAAHFEISPGRKYDTTPLFPLEKFRSIARGNADPDPIAAAPAADGTVSVDGLNLRRWPSNNDNVIAVLNRGDTIEVIRSGVYADGFPEARWHLVKAARHPEPGWLHSAYVDLV
ncbi:N-acetylmuramoyl-L-alanine amidase [Acuticoccus sediminis]|uniref:N-acetylmuramoyl-L-alanine amidase n=1 Tax=Acuticoccus sediminis TaxID=2184697 RepID=UPI001CFDD8D3|nr:N-acetylmuramoyl-L-alanine amidase [Acuticoccus sediminis]